MITDGIIFLVFSFVSGLVSLLPTGGTLPTGMTDAFAFFLSSAQSWSAILPVTTFFTVAGIILSFEGGILGFKFITWIIRAVRG